MLILFVDRFRGGSVFRLFSTGFFFFQPTHRLLQAYDDAITSSRELKANRKRTDSFQREAAVKKFEDSVVGLNLTGIDCFVCKPVKHLTSFLKSEAASISALELLSRPTSLDPILDDERKINLQLKGSEGCPTKSLKVRAGVAELWDTSHGELLVQVLVNRPPQLLLLVSSPMILANRTLLDLEVKLSNVSNLQMEASEWPPFCIPIQFLDGSQGTPPPEATSMATSKAWKAAAEFVKSHTLFLPSGFYLALPPKALGSFEAAFQLRPAPSSVGGMHLSWGGLVSPLRVMESDGYAAYSRSVCPDVSMPAYGLRLAAERTENQCQISIEAPFRLCNACPVDLSYHLCWSNAGSFAPRVLDQHNGTADANGMLHINDGYGGIWDVPPNGFAYVAPLRLRQNSFQWWLGKTKEHQDCPHRTNVVTVKRDGRKVSWQFCEAGRGISKQLSARLAPGDEASKTPNGRLVLPGLFIVIQWNSLKIII